jgi:dolichol-phosphate mannosyltransferase
MISLEELASYLRLALKLTDWVCKKEETITMIDNKAVEVRPLENTRDAHPLVIVAALNEEAGIGPTLTELRVCLDEPSFLVVDGQSTDSTVRIAVEMGAKVVTQKGSGKGDAIAAGIARAKFFQGQYVVFIDADYTYPATQVPKMISILEKNPDVGMVCGNRFPDHRSLSAMHDIFYLGNRLLAFTHNLLNGVDLQDPLTGLRTVRWQILKHWKPRARGFDVEVELNHFIERQGFHIMEIPINYRPRLGKKKLKLKHGFTIFNRILTESIQLHYFKTAEG